MRYELFVLGKDRFEDLAIAWALVSLGAISCLCFSVILIGLTVTAKTESDQFIYRLGQFLGLLVILGVYAILLAYAIAIILSFGRMFDLLGK